MRGQRVRGSQLHSATVYGAVCTADDRFQHRGTNGPLGSPAVADTSVDRLAVCRVEFVPAACMVDESVLERSQSHGLPRNDCSDAQPTAKARPSPRRATLIRSLSPVVATEAAGGQADYSDARDPVPRYRKVNSSLGLRSWGCSLPQKTRSSVPVLVTANVLVPGASTKL